MIRLKAAPTLHYPQPVQSWPFILGTGAVAAGVYQNRFRTDVAAVDILGFQSMSGFLFAPDDDLIIDFVTGDDDDATLWPDNPGNRPIIPAGLTETPAGIYVPDIRLLPPATSLRAKVDTPLPATPGSFVTVMMHWRYL